MIRGLRPGSWAAVGVVLIAATGGCMADAPSGSVDAPASTGPWVTFTSERYGYAIDHPADWEVRERAGEVLPVSQRIGSPGTDVIGHGEALRAGSDDGLVQVSAHELEPDEDLTAFSRRFSSSAACGDAGISPRETELGGVSAESRDFSCGGYDWMQTVAIHGDRGYVVWLVGTQPPDPADRPLLIDILGTFRFTDPEAAATEPA